MAARTPVLPLRLATVVPRRHQGARPGSRADPRKRGWGPRSALRLQAHLRQPRPSTRRAKRLRASRQLR
ncbi:hypothetical protein [Streptomyces sp. Ag109_G2-15]|uniref:hypothetical protein n=1 Tax=Streptomyces sp. Ag109_G2-15 TaxID=1938850 RepID=UPI0027BB0EEE|nr:hypothetical protein [Streptomyces sp. Ag109_G2-15]